MNVKAFLASLAKNTSVTMPFRADQKRDAISNNAVWYEVCDGLRLVLLSDIDLSRYEQKIWEIRLLKLTRLR